MRLHNLFLSTIAPRAAMLFQAPDPPGGPNPPAPPPPPPADAPITPPTPPRVANQSAEDRVAQLEDINANLRVEAATRRVSERTVKDQLAANQRELDGLRTELSTRVTAARAEGQQVAEKVKKRAIDAELKAAAATAGLQDMDLLPLIERTGLACDDDGNVTGAAEAVAAFKTKKPEFFRAAPAPRPGETITIRSGSPAPPAPPPGPGGTPTGPDVRTMPKKEYGDAKKAALSSLR